MAEARRMGKSELFSHFAERFEMKRTQSREFFDELAALCEKELKRSGEFVLPGMVKLVVQKRKARMGRNPATGDPIKIPAKTVVKARIVKQLKDAVLPRKEDRTPPPASKRGAQAPLFFSSRPPGRARVSGCTASLLSCGCRRASCTLASMRRCLSRARRSPVTSM
jgi:DNA-binding protein HU-beta